MKTKSQSQSAFLNVRLLAGLLMLMAGLFLALLGFGTSPARAQQTLAAPGNPLVPDLFDCAQIHSLGIDVQENFRAGAIMIYCGEAAAGEPAEETGVSPVIKQLLGPLAFGATDFDLVTGTETSPRVTQ